MISMQFSRSHGQPLQKPREMQQMLKISLYQSRIPVILRTSSMHIRILDVQKRFGYHDEAHDASKTYFISFIKQKKARYLNALYDIDYFILLCKYPYKLPKKARYHDVVIHKGDKGKKTTQNIQQRHGKYTRPGITEFSHRHWIVT